MLAVVASATVTVAGIAFSVSLLVTQQAAEVAGVWRQAHLGWSTSDRRPTIHRSDGTGRPGRR